MFGRNNTLIASVALLGYLSVAAGVGRAQPITVLGTADPWLAGMPNGSTASNGDTAPAQSPTQVTGVTLVPGTALTFSATGSVSNSGGVPTDPPDGSGSTITPHLAGAQNGISNVTVPLNSLLGVFLDNSQPDTTGAPTALDFSPGGNVPGGTNYLVLSPLLKQVFFIGDGRTSSSVAQQVIVPAGATRLFLGPMDGEQWSNNTGSFSVTVAPVPEPQTLVLTGLGLAAVYLGRRRP